jgi:hypothetical protein
VLRSGLAQVQVCSVVAQQVLTLLVEDGVGVGVYCEVETHCTING